VNVRVALVAALALAAGPARADRGHIWLKPVQLAETSQKAIVLHNGEEEVLVLGVELEAARQAEILEFIPFPSEPAVALAEGDPFDQARRLVREKRLEAQGPPVKGGPGRPVAVELTFAARMGVHDVAVVRVNDADGFEAWVRDHFRREGLESPLDLGPALAVARDYLARGYRHFVFDQVTVGPERRFAAPLVYRFRSERLYYPLRTSNLVGGDGAVQLVMILPGSFLHEEAPEAIRHVWRALQGASDVPWAWRVSSSAKILPAEAETVYPGAARFFARTPKLYLQALGYVGPYRFGADLLLDLGDLGPYASKLRSWEDLDGVVLGRDLDFPGYTDEEIQDYCEALPSRPPCQARAHRATGGRKK
jgi:hypothetical protein